MEAGVKVMWQKLLDFPGKPGWTPVFRVDTILHVWQKKKKKRPPVHYGLKNMDGKETSLNQRIVSAALTLKNLTGNINAYGLFHIHKTLLDQAQHPMFGPKLWPSKLPSKENTIT